MSNIAPFVRPISIQGGTFYTMSSASEDLGFTFNNDGKIFKFSKYVLLNIPDIKRPTLGELNWQNYVQLDAIPGAFQYVHNGKTQNMMLAESFQNYVLNLETMLTQYSTYDVNDLQSVSERVFFKWLKETGAIRFREANTTESPLEAGLRFTEEDSSDKYSRIVQYIGQIDIVNSVKTSADAYSEVYIHVPTKDGATPLVLFKSLNDDSYFPAQNLVNTPADAINTELIVGRNQSSINPAGLVIQAFFDSDYNNYGEGATVGLTSGDVTFPSIGYQLFKWDETISDYVVNWWFPYPEGNSYWTQPAAITGTFDDPRNDCYMLRGIRETGATGECKFQRSRVDGIMLDFNESNYNPIASNPIIKSFSDFNGLAETTSFDFNAVLVYYDIQDVSSGQTATNLFGVLFLDNVEDTDTGGGTIPRLSKYKPNRITGLNGNSFGFKINLKFDINSDDAAIVSAVNEYAPFSMQIFVDALNQLQAAADTLTGQTSEVEKLSQNVESLKDLVYNESDLEELNQRVTILEEQLLSAGAIFENSQTVLDLIERNYQEILNIYANKTSVTVSYNLDTIVSGEGISLDKSTPNQVIIKNSEQCYTIDSSPLYNVLTSFTNTPSAWVKELSLKKFGNYMKISNGAEVVFDRDIQIFINDSEQRWNPGQTFKIVIDHNYPIDMYTNGSFDLLVFTDSKDRLNTGQTYSKQIGRISSNEFFKKDGHAQMEIVCLNSDTYTFTYDVI